MSVQWLATCCVCSAVRDDLIAPEYYVMRTFRIFFKHKSVVKSVTHFDDHYVHSDEKSCFSRT
jgi:hypothetical protein